MDCSNKKNIMIYYGKSMTPLFSGGDILHILPCECSDLKAGDVIVFSTPSNQTFIAHRIFSIGKEGIKTKGDNSKSPDIWVLNSNNIIGKVSHIQKDNKLRKVYGGLAGRTYYVFNKLFMAVKNISFLALRPVYNGISEKGLCSFFSLNKSSIDRRGFRGLLTARLLVVKKNNEKELQLLIGRYLIGRLRNDRNKWEIKRPFRVFINEKTLPIERGDIR